MSLDAKTYNSFSSISIPVLHLNEDGDMVDEDDNVYTPGFTTGGSGEITVVRVLYPWEFFTPMISVLLSDTGNSKLLSSTAIFRNEPYE